MERTPIQVPVKFNNRIKKDLTCNKLTRNGEIKTRSQLLIYYRKLALQFIKQTK